MTKILHISNTDIDLDSRIRKELKALAELPGSQVSVLGVPDANGVGPSEIDGALYHKLRISSRRLKVLPRAARYFFELIEFTIKASKAGRQIRPDIVHCHDTFPLPAGWILKRLVGCQLVYDAHELESNKNAQNAILSKATLLIEKVCWKQVDLLVSVSDSITDWYVRNLGFKPSVLVLNSPAIVPDTDIQDTGPERGHYFHEKYGIPAGHLVFVYLGILVPGRGIEICLDAFAAGPQDAHVVFMGFGRLEQVITEYSESHSNIHVHQRVPHDQVVPLVRNADYGLCLVENVSMSDYYCLPNKLFEYCFAGLPVLASNFPEISKLVEQYSLGFCCAPDPDNVRVALGQLIGLRPPCLTSDITALSWETQATRLRSVYRTQLMGSPNVSLVH
jgi:glycosyltransferase involved in cell wall biosynthesis